MQQNLTLLATLYCSDRHLWHKPPCHTHNSQGKRISVSWECPSVRHLGSNPWLQAKKVCESACTASLLGLFSSSFILCVRAPSTQDNYPLELTAAHWLATESHSRATGEFPSLSVNARGITLSYLYKYFCFVFLNSRSDYQATNWVLFPFHMSHCIATAISEPLFATWGRHRVDKRIDLGELSCGSAFTVREPDDGVPKNLTKHPESATV